MESRKRENFSPRVSAPPLGKSPILMEWDEFPSGELVPDFIGRLRGELDKRGVSKEAPLYFICRSGNRSRQAPVPGAGSHLDFLAVPARITHSDCQYVRCPDSTTL